MSAVLLYFSLCFTVLQNSLFCNAVTASVDKLQQKQERHMWILSNLLQSISHTRVTLSYDSKCTRQPCSFAVVTIETHRVHWYIDSMAKLHTDCLACTQPHKDLSPDGIKMFTETKTVLGSFCRLSTVWNGFMVCPHSFTNISLIWEKNESSKCLQKSGVNY